MKAIAVDGWQGRSYYACEIVGETRTRYRVRLLRDAVLPARRQARAGDILAVPKYAVREISKQRMEMDPPKHLFKTPHSPEMEH